MNRFVRIRHEGAARVARLLEDETVEVLDHDEPLAAIGGRGATVATAALAGVELLAPIEAPEIWCAGVTYERSRDARLEEAETEARDVYALVYDADRPELFLKDASMRRTVGPGGTIRTRRDARWNVPEPELGVVIGEAGEAAAVTVGNDVSSRDIEGANPLYIPQAKIFAGGCAIGPALAVPDNWDSPWAIRLRITDGDRELFTGETSTAKMRRTPRELVSWVMRDNPVPAGSVLLTGTGLVPEDQYTLQAGHRVEITIDGIGTLVNIVGGDG
ncbi:MAG TPA: fumarylacetoacetate hydrolase family protein [Gaiellaceae bacterium]|nr:fumarylacetoacetate hydrolase family protein [Gaiellaceae bacterium]